MDDTKTTHIGRCRKRTIVAFKKRIKRFKVRTGWKKKILVANDSAEMRFLTEEAFTMEGYTAVLAEIAEEALELQPKAKCLVVFLDFN